MKALLRSVLAGLGYRIQGTRYCPRQLFEPAAVRSIEFDDVVCRRMFEVGPQLNFIQVGAFDGITSDPLHRYIAKCGWRGAVLEPQTRGVRCLTELYRDNDGIVILPVAVDRQRGNRTLFTVDAEPAAAWAGGLASFDRECVLKHSELIPGLATVIREQTVDCVTFDEVLERLGFDHIDVLQIDTEGADAHILSLFPLDRVEPAIIHWEVKHLSKTQREECIERLLAHGYRVAPSGDEDMMAVRF